MPFINKSGETAPACAIMQAINLCTTSPPVFQVTKPGDTNGQYRDRACTYVVNGQADVEDGAAGLCYPPGYPWPVTVLVTRQIEGAPGAHLGPVPGQWYGDVNRVECATILGCDIFTNPTKPIAQCLLHEPRAQFFGCVGVGSGSPGGSSMNCYLSLVTKCGVSTKGTQKITFQQWGRWILRVRVDAVWTGAPNAANGVDDAMASLAIYKNGAYNTEPIAFSKLSAYITVDNKAVNIRGTMAMEGIANFASDDYIELRPAIWKNATPAGTIKILQGTIIGEWLGFATPLLPSYPPING